MPIGLGITDCNEEMIFFLYLLAIPVMIRAVE